MKNNIVAVVVTYNRKHLLIECLEAIRKQSNIPDAIYIIDNSSTDGTPELLFEKQYINHIHQKDINRNQSSYHSIVSLNDSNTNIRIKYIQKANNDGGAGGFYEGIKQGYEDGFEWIWVMDDDVSPYDNCLENLINITKDSNYSFDVLQPDRILLGQESRRWQYGTKLNLKNPFKKLTPESKNVTDFPNCQVFEIVSFPFEGPIFNRKVIEKIGNVDNRLFINYDDTDYSIRVVKAGFKIGLVCNALLLKKLGFNQANIKNDFKLYYQIRNSIIIERKHINNTFAISRGIHKSFRTMSSFLYYSIKEMNFSLFTKSFLNISKAFIDGITFKIN